MQEGLSPASVAWSIPADSFQPWGPSAEARRQQTGVQPAFHTLFFSTVNTSHAPSRIGNLNPRPVAPGGEARGALPTRPRTAAISGTGIVHRGIGPSQIGGPAHLTR